MRAPSLLRALVVRLTIVVVLALAGIYPILYFEFRDGLMGLDGQSIAIQVQDLRKSIVSGTTTRMAVISSHTRALAARNVTIPVREAIPVPAEMRGTRTIIV